MTDLKFPVLEKYGVNLTRQAHQNKLDLSHEVDATLLLRMTQIIGRRARNRLILMRENPELDIIYLHHLANKLIQSDVFESLENVQLFSIDLKSFDLAKIPELINELSTVAYRSDTKHEAIVFLDNAGDLMVPHSNITWAIKRAIVRREIDGILSMTLAQHQLLGNDPAFERHAPFLCLDDSMSVT